MKKRKRGLALISDIGMCEGFNPEMRGESMDSKIPIKKVSLTALPSHDSLVTSIICQTKPWTMIA